VSDEIKSKEKAFEFPMMPIFGVDLGERLGDLAAGQRQLSADIQKLEARMDKLEAKIDAVDAKLTAKIDAVDARVDKCLVAISRLDERMTSMADAHKADFQHVSDAIKSDRTLMYAILAAVVAGFFLQYFAK
jgi:predicted  nucleic acid-binding Zn-ribbon protein